MKKHILYIDQFALCEMLKELDDASPRPSRRARNAFYSDLFVQLDRLGKLMQIVCPYSASHLSESKAIEEPGANESARTEKRAEFGKRFEQLRRLVCHLSFDTKFLRYETIRQSQILAGLEDWIKGGTASQAKRDPSEAVSGRINAWLPTLYPTLDLPLDPDEVQTICTAKANVGKRLDAKVCRWRSEKHKKFEDWFEEEIASHGGTLLNAYARDEPKLQALRLRCGLERLPLPRDQTAALTLRIFQRLENDGTTVEKCKQRASEFLASKVFSQVPVVRIGAALWAGLAHRIARGGKKKVETSFASDVQFLSAYLPYCDAMFIDNACAEMVKNRPVSQAIQENVRVFSMHTKNEFLSFLKGIESSVPPEHLTKVSEVYGSEWLTPSQDLLKS